MEDDEILVQLVQDFIESSDDYYSSSSSSSSSCSDANASNLFSSSHSDYAHHSNYFILREILEEEETGAEAEVLHSVMKLMKRRRIRKGGDGESINSSSKLRNNNNLRKRIVVGLQMEGYLASLCHTSPCLQHCQCSIKCGDYEYIDVLIPDKNGQLLRLIVDIDFRSQFEVARPTRTYKDLTDILPPVFVGTESKLNRIISLLCGAAKQSLRESGLHVPPWRTATYMQSKWLSSNNNNNNNSNNNQRNATEKLAIKSNKVYCSAAAAPSNGGFGVKGCC